MSVSSMKLQLIKGDAQRSHQAILAGAASDTVSLDQFSNEDEALRWIARYGVQRYCGLSGGFASAAEAVPQTAEAMQTEIVVKVLVDAHSVPAADATHVRNTSLLLLRGLNQPTPQLSVSAIAFCLSFMHRTVTRWESLEAGQSFELTLDPRS